MASSTSSYNADRESSSCFGARAQSVDEQDDDYTLSLQLMRPASTYFTGFDAKGRRRLVVVHDLNHAAGRSSRPRRSSSSPRSNDEEPTKPSLSSFHWPPAPRLIDQRPQSYNLVNHSGRGTQAHSKCVGTGCAAPVV